MSHCWVRGEGEGEGKGRGPEWPVYSAGKDRHLSFLPFQHYPPYLTLP